MVSFREAGVDEESAHALLAEYFEARALGFPGGKDAYSLKFPDPAQFVRPNGVFIVVEDVDLADEPADVGCGGIRRIPAGPSGLPRLEIKHLWLKPYLRGRGFGRVLLTELERRATEDFGARQIVLDTNASLEAAGGLYRSSGYVEIEPYNDNPNATHWFGKTVA
jgi:ribosomal protein S18 acetylase RimI-like enzyme